MTIPTAALSGTFYLGGDLPVQRLGFGAMRITGPGIWGPPTDRGEAIATLRRALDLGVNLIDTAESYGPFVSEELIAEVKRLRTGIRAHRDSTGHELCWHHPELWGLLPEKLAPDVAVPPWPNFLRGCLRYRESLDRELPNAPVADVEYE